MARTSTIATSLSLVYGTEVVLSIELEVKSLRIMLEVEILENEWVSKRYDEVTFSGWKKTSSSIPHAGLSEKIVPAFNRKVK